MSTSSKHTPVKILFYAINGTGLGHLSRLLNIARQARELLNAQGLKADFQFLTTSEAPQLAWDFPVYKLPSKTLINDCDTSNQQFAAQAKFLISNLAASFRPDLLVMDTVPEGSFQEFLFLKDYARATVFINRHKNETASQSAVHKMHLALYDLILIPDNKTEATRYSLSKKLTERSHFCGTVHSYQAEESLTREELRQQFSVREDQDVIYVSAGGGGDRKASQDLELIVNSLSRDPKNFLIVAYGPLYRGQKIYRSNVIPYSDPHASRLFGAIDYAISAAGYNSFQELLAAAVPTLFFAQVKGLDRQDERILLGQDKGWNLVLGKLNEESLQEGFHSLKEKAITIREVLTERPQSYGSLNCAVEILKLHASLKRSPIERPDLYGAWQKRRNYSGLFFADTAQTLQSYLLSSQSEISLLEMNEEAALNYRLQESHPATARAMIWATKIQNFLNSSELSSQQLNQFLKSFFYAASADPQLRESRQRILEEFFELNNSQAFIAGELLMALKSNIKIADIVRTLALITERIQADSSYNLAALNKSILAHETKIDFQTLEEIEGMMYV